MLIPCYRIDDYDELVNTIKTSAQDFASAMHRTLDDIIVAYHSSENTCRELKNDCEQLRKVCYRVGRDGITFFYLDTRSHVIKLG